MRARNVPVRNKTRFVSSCLICLGTWSNGLGPTVSLLLQNETCPPPHCLHPSNASASSSVDRPCNRSRDILLVVPGTNNHSGHLPAITGSPSSAATKVSFRILVARDVVYRKKLMGIAIKMRTSRTKLFARRRRSGIEERRRGVGVEGPEKDDARDDARDFLDAGDDRNEVNEVEADSASSVSRMLRGTRSEESRPRYMVVSGYGAVDR